jgi:NOL1/NOP2/sun family putative RNA methylase
MLNDRFIERIKNILGEDGLREYLKSFEKEPSRALRFNPLKSDLRHINALSDTLISPLDFWEGAYLFSQDKIGTHPYHHAGAFYIQEPSAMTPVSAVEITPDMKILDTCASPGGKSTQAAQLLKNGFLVSNEIIPSRAKTLSGNIERLGFGNVTVTNTDTETLAKTFPEFFDLVIVDAPCSGEGMFRKDSGAVTEWSEENVFMCAARQREILDNASKCVKKSGKFLYSTCTFSVEENEENVSHFLSEHSDFRLIPPSEKACRASCEGVGIPNARRIYPHTSLGEGQFFAVFERINGDSAEKMKFKSALKAPSAEDMNSVRDFIAKNLTSFPEGKILSFKDNLVLVPENLPVPEKITYSCGITLGRVEKRVFRPHHQLFSALGGLFKSKIHLSAESDEIIKYLHGETFTPSAETPDGWACVCVDSISLGGAKVSGGIVKNHYPKGLRNL